MQKRTKIIITFIVILVVIISGIIHWRINIYQPPEYYARKHWDDICEKIDRGMVVSAVVTDGRGDGEEIDIENCLSPADFSRYLIKDVSPPTPYYQISIIFSDDSEVTLNNWDTPVFSVYYRERYYELNNDELFSRIEAAKVYTN